MNRGQTKYFPGIEEKGDSQFVPFFSTVFSVLRQGGFILQIPGHIAWRR